MPTENTHLLFTYSYSQPEIKRRKYAAEQRGPNRQNSTKGEPKQPDPTVAANLRWNRFIGWLQRSLQIWNKNFVEKTQRYIWAPLLSDWSQSFQQISFIQSECALFFTRRRLSWTFFFLRTSHMHNKAERIKTNKNTTKNNWQQHRGKQMTILISGTGGGDTFRLLLETEQVPQFCNIAQFLCDDLC